MTVKRVIYPPIWLAFGIVTIFVLNEFYPGSRFTSVAGQVAGGVTSDFSDQQTARELLAARGLVRA